MLKTINTRRILSFSSFRHQHSIDPCKMQLRDKPTRSSQSSWDTNSNSSSKPNKNWVFLFLLPLLLKSSRRKFENSQWSIGRQRKHSFSSIVAIAIAQNLLVNHAQNLSWLSDWKMAFFWHFAWLIYFMELKLKGRNSFN